MPMFRIIFSPLGIFLLFGIVLFAAGLVLRIRECLFCKQDVDAECVSINYHIHRRGSGLGRVNSNSPVWRYEWNGRTYFRQDQNGNSVINYRVGDHCTLRIDPNRPERFYRKGMSNAVIMMLCGIGVIVLTVPVMGFDWMIGNW